MPLLKITHIQNKYVGGDGSGFADVTLPAYINPNAVTSVDFSQYSDGTAYIFIRMGAGESDQSYRISLEEWQRIEPLLAMPAPAETFKADPVPQVAIDNLILTGNAWNIQRAIKAVQKAYAEQAFTDPIEELTDLYELVKDMRRWPLPESVIRAWNVADIVGTVSKDMEAYDLANHDIFEALGQIIAPDRFPIDGEIAPRSIAADAVTLYELFHASEIARAEWLVIETEAQPEAEAAARSAYIEALSSILDAIRPYFEQLMALTSGAPLSTTPKTEGED